MGGCFGRAWHPPFPKACAIWGEKAQGAPLRCYRGLEAVGSAGMRHPLQCCWFPLPCKGGPGTLWGRRAHAHDCCGAAVSLFWEFLQADLSEKALCRVISTPASKHIHPSSCPTQELALPHLWLLRLPLLPRLKHPTDAKAGLCLPAALGKSWAWVLSPVQVSTVHTLWQKIGSTLGIASVPSSRCGAGAGSQQQLVGW